MAMYGFDKENAKYIPEEYIQSEHIVAHDTRLGYLVDNYMNKTVTKILLAKNQALLNDRTHRLAEELKTQDQADNGEELNENYLKKHIVRDADDNPITDEKAMAEWVKNNFHFVLSDIQSENAWIFDDKKHDKKTIAVTTKMLDFAENSSQLEGIIAHELGHYFVSQRYEHPEPSINEKMADQHAVDCLYYMGKSPEEYGIVFDKLYGLSEMNDAERILSGLIDPHGSPTTRLQDIDNYNEALYGDYIEELDDNPDTVARIAADDQEFNELKTAFKQVYSEGCYIGILEETLMAEESLKSFVSEETGRIDFTQIPYEQVLDILIAKADDNHFCSMQTLEEAAEFLTHSSKEGLELNERITQKVNTLLEKAGTSVLLSGHGYNQETIKQELRDRTYNSLDSEYKEPSLARIIKAEAEAKGETIVAEQMAEKIEQILLENNIAIAEESQLITYQGQQFLLSKYGDDTMFLLLDRADSPVLSPEIKEKRGEILNLNDPLIEKLNNIHNNEQNKFIDAFDKLCFAAAYPSLDLETYFKEYSSLRDEKQKDSKEQTFLNEVISAPHITIKPISTYNKYIQEWQREISGPKTTCLSTYNENKLPIHSRLAIDLPAFEMPPAEEALGTILPWNHIEGARGLAIFGLKLDEHVNETEATARDYTPVTEIKQFRNIVSQVRFADRKPYDFFADENGKITIVGEHVSELKQQKNIEDKQHKEAQISTYMEESIKTLDAITTVSILNQTGQEHTLNENERKLLEGALRYLVETPDLEPHLLGQNLGIYLQRIRDETKELNYQNMPDNAPQINQNFANLQKSVFYQHFFVKGDEENLTSKQKKERLIAVQNWQAGDKTASALQTILPVVSNIMEQREERLQEKSDKFHSVYIQSEWRHELSRKASICAKDLSEADKKAILPCILEIKIREIQQVNDLFQLHEKTGSYSGHLGIPGDELVYTHTISPYYEAVREKLKLRETKGNPNALYANLTSQIEAVEDIAPNRNEEITKKLKNIQEYEQNEAGRFWRVGSYKLNSRLTSDDYKLAEYEVMRYINEPSNPPLDCQELLRAFPRYAFILFEERSCTDAFRQALGNYILEKSNFKELDFYQQRKIYEQMLHKDLFDKQNTNKLEFLEAIKISYQRLPEAEKTIAALSMLQDKTFNYNEIKNRGLSPYDYLEKEKNETKTMADYPPIRNFFVTEYADRFSQEIGLEPIEGEAKPDGTKVTSEDCRQYQEKITSFINMVNSTITAAPEIKEALFARVADNIEAQAETSKRFEVGLKHIESDRDMSAKNELGLRLTSSFNEYLTIAPKNNIVVIDFLTTPFSPESAEKFRQDLYEHTIEAMPLIYAAHSGEDLKPLDDQAKKEIREGLNEMSNEDLCITHADFWDKSLEDRSVVMQRLLENATGNNIDKSVDLVIDKYLNSEEPYYKEAKDVLKTLYKTGAGGGHYRKDKARFMLGSMLGAQEPTKENSTKNMGIGQALALFCSANGPAWVKFGQALSNIPNLPDDIRKPLSILKDRAVSKNRWELFRELEQNLPKEKFASIKKIGKVLGAGSFFSSVGVELKDGTKHVLQMMAPDAPKKAKSEFKKIIRSVKDLTKIDKMYAVLNKIVERADESTKTEVNIQKGYEQYAEAAKNYAMIDKLEVNGIKFKLHLVPWTDKHQDENGNGFKQMEFAEGKSLSRIDCTPEEKKALAAGYIATELGILLGGKAWDIDRHNGQQNFNVTRDKDGKITDVEIGIFDTGALRPAPKEQDKALITNFYAAVLRASINGDNINDVMFKEVQNIEDKGIDAAYVSDVQRGCIALSDLCEYQKEERDTQGNITQKSQSFSQKDYLNILGAVINSGLIDHKIIDPLLTKVVKDKKIIVSIVKQQAHQRFNKLKQLVTGKTTTTPSTTELQITMSAKGSLTTKQQNKQIDQIIVNSEDNAFRTPTRPKITQKEKRRNKISRMLQAAYIKYMRRNGEDAKASGSEGIQSDMVSSSETIQYTVQEGAKSRETEQNPIITKPENNNSDNSLSQPKSKEKKNFIGWLKNKFSKPKKVIDSEEARQLSALRQGFNPRTNPQGNSPTPVNKTTVNIAMLKKGRQETK